jgi:solute carrier family 25 carnitine/acylcarnitine transporter 20/29
MQTVLQGQSTWSAAKNIVARDGWLGLYRGVSPVFAATPPMLAINFWAYHISQKFLYEQATAMEFQNVSQLSLLQVGGAGALAAVPTGFLLAPAEQIKIRLQVSNGTSSAIQELKSIWKQSGPRGLFRGTLLTVARDVPGSFFYFLTYEGIKRTFGDSIPIILFAGGMAGIVNWTIAIPCDTIKSRIQASNSSNISAALTELLRNDGVKGLFRGLRPTLLRAFPASAAFFFGVEGSARLMM